MSDKKTPFITLTRYQVETPLTDIVSAYADLYLAKDTITKRKVILKVFKPEWIKDFRTRSRLMQILQRNADLVHPHIAWVWDIGEESGQLFSAERFVQGPTLETRLAKGRRLSWEESLLAFRHTAQALDFLHARGILHGELSPANMRFDPEHGVILFDIGVSQAFIPTIAPASASHVISHPTPESDQVSLTKVFLLMLAGKSARLTSEGLPEQWPFGVPYLIEPALKRGLGISPEGHYPTNMDYFEAVAELASLPQPAPTPEEIALHQAELQAWQAEDEAERQQAEEASRQAALEAVKKEIDEHIQQAQGAQPDIEPEKPEQAQGMGTEPGAAVATPTPSSSGEAPAEPAPGASADITVAASSGGAAQPPAKRKRRRRGGCVFFLILLLLLILVVIGLWYVLTYNPTLPAFMTPWVEALRNWINSQAWITRILDLLK